MLKPLKDVGLKDHFLFVDEERESGTIPFEYVVFGMCGTEDPETGIKTVTRVTARVCYSENAVRFEGMSLERVVRVFWPLI